MTIIQCTLTAKFCNRHYRCHRRTVGARVIKFLMVILLYENTVNGVAKRRLLNAEQALDEVHVVLRTSCLVRAGRHLENQRLMKKRCHKFLTSA